MRLAELAARSGLSSATIKYYLRSGLLPPGETQSSTWAEYHESHVRRLRLVRALTDVAGMSLEDVRRVVTAVETSDPGHPARGAAQWPLSSPPGAEPTPSSLARVDELLSRHGWQLHPDSPHRAALALALDTLEQLDFPATDEVLDGYVKALGPVAELEVARVVAEKDPVVAAEKLVIGTMLYEPVLTTVRRIAHEVVSAVPQGGAVTKG